MGFLNKKPVIRQEGFHPLELNEDNVRAIFERCLATKDTPEADEQLSILFKKSWDMRKIPNQSYSAKLKSSKTKRISCI